ncbi:MAG: phospholipase D family protein [Janthinobacterium lividum]
MKISKRTAKQAIRQAGKLGGLNLNIIGMIILGFGLGVGFEEMNGIGTWHSYHAPTDKLNVCFTPPSGCGNLIAIEISKAAKSIYVQAYGMTSKPIVRELIKAKMRGLRIGVLLDSSNIDDSSSKMQELIDAGIEVRIDKVPGIAHNKVIIIDKKKVITGSFNFTNAADNINVENVILIENASVAGVYLQNWLSRKAKITSR